MTTADTKDDAIAHLIDEAARRVVATMPPLTAEQRARLAVLLRSG